MYEEYGCETRKEYLQYLSDEYAIDLYVVKEIAELLGENEDFDGLVSSLEELI